MLYTIRFITVSSPYGLHIWYVVRAVTGSTVEHIVVLGARVFLRRIVASWLVMPWGADVGAIKINVCRYVDMHIL